MWRAFINLIAQGLQFFNTIISDLGIPYSFGFAIILFTVVIKGLTYPLNRQQIKSTQATQELQPKLKVLQKKYANDKEKLAQVQMEMYREAGVNPLGGCLPTLVQMPIWFALYRALYQLAGTSPDLQEGFFWIPSLAGPVTDRAAGIGWLTQLVNGAPQMGWPAAIGYLVLPVLLVVSQLYMQRMMTPQTGDHQQKTMSQAMMFMPFMFGYFALIVPSGLSLYWFTNNILSLGQQYLMNRSKEKSAQAQTKTSQRPAEKAAPKPEPDGTGKTAQEPGQDFEKQAGANGQPESKQPKPKPKPRPTRTRSRSKRKRKKQR
ncbi:MAG: YidC/Oxa1 family membrane protein insertase [Anaerolineae bacterium]